jgi:uncharacterized membrane protein YdbT with pleckstrin-like domain
MEIKPDKKLLTKQWYILLTISFFIVLFAVLLQILIPISPEVTSGQAAAILWPITLGVIILLWIISAPIIILWINNLGYYIDEDRITIHKGILSKIKQNVPYRAITDFQLHRSLYDRALGIGSIRIQTAGQRPSATGYEANLAGLVGWEELLEQLREKVKKLYPQALASTKESSGLTEKEILNGVLEELREIRKLLARRD